MHRISAIHARRELGNGPIVMPQYDRHIHTTAAQQFHGRVVGLRMCGPTIDREALGLSRIAQQSPALPRSFHVSGHQTRCVRPANKHLPVGARGGGIGSPDDQANGAAGHKLSVDGSCFRPAIARGAHDRFYR